MGTIKDDLANETPTTRKTTATGEATRKVRSGPRTAYRPPTGNSHDFYKKNVAGVLQVAGAAVFPASPADACAILVHSEPISESVADLAEQDSRVATILDKLLEIGPYGALLTAVMPLALQILVNHNILKPGIMGSLSPGDIVEQIVGKTDTTSQQENRANGHVSTAASDVPA